MRDILLKTNSNQMHHTTMPICNNFLTITAQLVELNNDSVLHITTPIAKNTLSLIIDSGANACLLKAECLNKDIIIDNTLRPTFRGLTSTNNVTAIGAVKTKIVINGFEFEHYFFIIKDDINLNSNGIIGHTFLKAYFARIDYSKRTLKLSKPVLPPTATPTNTKYQVKAQSTNIRDDKALCIENKTNKRKKNVNFYSELPTNYFNNFSSKTEVTPTEINFTSFEDVAKEKLFQEKFHDNLKNVKSLNSVLSVNYFDKNEDSAITDPTLRANYVHKNLIKEAHNTEEKEILKNIASKYHPIFHLPGDQFTHANIGEYTIQLQPDATPSYVKQYRLPIKHQEILKEKIDELLKNKIISKCTSLWNSPVLLVPKKKPDGSIGHRMVVDLRVLNSKLLPIKTILPNIDDLIDKMEKSIIFSKVDVNQAYLQVKLAEASRKIIAFSDQYNSYCYNSVPFGLAASSQAWANVAHTALSDIPNIALFVDDILIYSKDMESHKKTLIKVFERLMKYNIKVKDDKCELLKPEVSYLGFIISAEGLRPNPDKVEVIRKWPRPSNLKKTQQYLGVLTYYRRFIKDFSKRARALFDLCKKDHKFEWTEDCEKAFLFFKEALSTPPLLLVFPDFTKDNFVLTTDSSNFAIGSVLSQGTPPKDNPIHYFSKVLSPAQQKYSTCEKELLAIIISVEYFSCYLIGRPFTLICDCRPLIFLYTSKNLSGKLNRWKYNLINYNIKWQHTKGSQNVLADALSRLELDPDTDGTKFLESMLHDRLYVDMLPALTRQQKQLKDLQHDNATPTQLASYEKYIITEQNNTVFVAKEYDHLFFFFEKENCTLHKKLQHKLKTKITLTNMSDENCVFSFDKHRTFLIMNPLIRSEAHIEKTKLLMNKVLAICQNQALENVAFNIEFHDPSSYFQFKQIVKECMHTTTIKVTFFLNKIIEVFDIEAISKILKAYHDSGMAMHPGINRMKNNIRRYYSWPSMTTDIKEYVKNCQHCEQAKISSGYNKNPMVIMDTLATRPFERCFIDIVGPVNPTGLGIYQYVLTCICELSKMVIAVPLENADAKTTARALIRSVFLKHGVPSQLISDNGSNFKSSTMAEITKILKAKQIFISPYHPQSNKVERWHRYFADSLKCCIEKEHDQWPEYLPYAVFSYNNSYNIATKLSPNEIVYGTPCRIPVELTKRKPPPQYTYDNYVHELKEKLYSYHQMARKNIEKQAEVNKKYYDKNISRIPLNLKENDLCLVQATKKKSKFSRPWEGPFRVVKRLSPVTILIKKRNKMFKIHTNRVKKSHANYKEKTPPRL